MVLFSLLGELAIGIKDVWQHLNMFGNTLYGLFVAEGLLDKEMASVCKEMPFIDEEMPSIGKEMTFLGKETPSLGQSLQMFSNP